MEAKRNGDDAGVAKAYGVSEFSVRSACREYGVDLPHKRQGNRTLIIVRMLVDGEKQSDIARELGVSRQLVSRVKKAAIEASLRLSAVAHGGFQQDGASQRIA